MKNHRHAGRTRPWKIFEEGPTKVKPGPFHDIELQPYTAQDFRFTTKGDVLYAIELAWPASNEAVIASLGSAAPTSQTILSVQLLGSTGALAFEQKLDGLHTKLPSKPALQPAYAFHIALSPAVASTQTLTK